MGKIIKSIIENEKKIYIAHLKDFKSRISAALTHDESYQIYKWSKELRITEYYEDTKDKSILMKICYYYHYRKMCILGDRLGFFISTGVLGKNVKIFHRGGIIINFRSKIGDGCRFHGDNCVGNNGTTTDCPVLGKNVDVGIGAKILGGVTIADDIKIGANAVVTKSFLEPGITIAGIPATKIEKKVNIDGQTN